MWKDKVILTSNRMFPGLIYYNYEKQVWQTGNIVKSNLLLQMALYFNVLLFPIWCLVIFLGLDAKYYNLTGIYKFISTGVYLIIICIECIRLYFGYLGNLSEKVPELASFWLLTVLIQFPLMGFILFNGNIIIYLVERILTILMILFLIIEMISSTQALKNIAKHHLKRFYTTQLCETDS